MIKRRILGTDANIKYKFPWRKKNTEEIEDYARRKMIKTLKKNKERKNMGVRVMCASSWSWLFLLLAQAMSPVVKPLRTVAGPCC